MAGHWLTCQYATEMGNSVPPQVPARDIDSDTSVPSQGAVPVEQESATADIVDLWGFDSFPASDPPANW